MVEFKAEIKNDRPHISPSEPGGWELAKRIKDASRLRVRMDRYNSGSIRFTSNKEFVLRIERFERDEIVLSPLPEKNLEKAQFTLLETISRENDPFEDSSPSASSSNTNVFDGG